jgi:hypothetical protein
MTEPRHITIDYLGRTYPVTHMCDRFGRDTRDPALASTCVVEFDGHSIEQDADDVPIYTVH